LLSSEIEPAIPEIERPQTNSLDRAATGIGHPFVNGLDLLKIQVFCDMT
jgi:hypothetical protein